MPDERWNELFAALRSNRDRAIVAFAISNGARASELLGMKGVNVDWGDQLARVVRKGAQTEQWLPASHLGPALPERGHAAGPAGPAVGCGGPYADVIKGRG